MLPELLERAITEFNARRYASAEAAAREGASLAATAGGRDALFWSGLHETCWGFALLMDHKLGPAEAKMASAIEKLRNFGYVYNELEVTSVLAGLRQGVEEIRHVRQKRKTQFDVTLLPNLKLAARADNNR